MIDGRCIRGVARDELVMVVVVMVVVLVVGGQDEMQCCRALHVDAPAWDANNHDGKSGGPVVSVQPQQPAAVLSVWRYTNIQHK